MTGALGSYHPMRLAYGLALGVTVKMIVHALALTYPEISALAALDSFNLVLFMVALAPWPFVPLIFAHGGADESISHQIRSINALLDAERATQAQRALVWRAVTTKYPSPRRNPSEEGKTKGRAKKGTKGEPANELLAEAKNELREGGERRRQV